MYRKCNTKISLPASTASTIGSGSRICIFDTRGLTSGCLGPTDGVFIGTHSECTRTKDSAGCRGPRWLLFSTATSTSRFVERVIR